ncbi:PREDICTED: uncharacterized protein LOC104610884 [Nelumbo nucifera]|uniref:Bifunctional inhibitor/plant lipid transfer protein/seed storage helical domain-containing protein n=2 Tax=Nelumbo nucifera TaxID=4432 RepID=A0A822XMW6_NELNU|nr:PREDICTED: uncharacterized protein LOC104610884 [Nelumbo nucifera]DAD20541.1 TPA_asm: hypothetical protein HUJ06_022004 [Nelumbo nucifera]
MMMPVVIFCSPKMKEGKAEEEGEREENLAVCIRVSGGVCRCCNLQEMEWGRRRERTKGEEERKRGRGPFAGGCCRLRRLDSGFAGCTTVLVGMSPCLNYITGNSSTPSSSCCLQLASVVKSNPRCLCDVLNGGVSSLGIQINQTQALTLPNACNVQTLPVSACNSNSFWVVSPTASPAGTPDTKTTPAVPAANPESKATPEGLVAGTAIAGDGSHRRRGRRGKRAASKITAIASVLSSSCSGSGGDATRTIDNIATFVAYIFSDLLLLLCPNPEQSSDGFWVC